METAREVRHQLHLAHDNGGGLTARGSGPPSPQMLGLLNGKLQEVFQGDHHKRISLLRWLWGIEESSEELTFGQVQATLNWLIDSEASKREIKQGGTYIIKAEAESACHAILRAYYIERGQMQLL